jgi:hypothetical protein
MKPKNESYPSLKSGTANLHLVQEAFREEGAGCAPLWNITSWMPRRLGSLLGKYNRGNMIRVARIALHSQRYAVIIIFCHKII